MAGELVFSVDGSKATPAQPTTLADAGLRERQELQEWVIANPEILGPSVLIVSFEFDRWQAADGSRERDRLDVLGFDPDGRLVVAELKRDRAPDTVEMQAIKYAAMASRFTEDTLVERYARHLARDGSIVDEDAARQRLMEHAGDIEIDQLRRPRIVLVAGAFPSIVTASAVWLSEIGVDITLQRVQAYRIDGGQTVVTVSQLYPLPEVEDFTISPQRARLKEVEDQRRRKTEGSTVVRLVNSGLITDGTVLTIVPTTEVPAEIRDAVTAWIAEEPARGRATWVNNRRAPLVWEWTGEASRPTPIIQRILQEVTGSARTPRGPAWWVLPDGRDLVTAVGASESRFDWSELHEALRTIPPGRWATYGDLAALVGTAPQALGQHLATCPVCENAHRVLGADGRPRENFAWTDPTDDRSQEQALRADGVEFDQGRASASQRLTIDELEGLR